MSAAEDKDRETALARAADGFVLTYEMGYGYRVSIPNLHCGDDGLEVVLKSRAEKAEEQADTLANALDCFFYDLRYTAPEMVGTRLNQLGGRITETMTELGYPKKGVTPKPETEAA